MPYNKQGDEMKQTVYVDVLVIINIYINYGLLLLTCFFRRMPTERLKILFSALIGGLYSLIILTDISDLMISLSRIPALLIMSAVAFGYKNKKEYLKVVFSFFGINMIFAGTMFMLWFLLCPENMYYNSGIVYFGIDAFTLVMLTVSAYLILRLISLFTKNKIPHIFSYTVKIYAFGKDFTCKGFLDTGNCLCDPFSGEGITVVHQEIFSLVIRKDTFSDYLDICSEKEFKLLPVKTVSGTKILPSFRADKIEIKNLEGNFYLYNPLIALCEEKIHGGEYGALLNSAIFDNAITGKGEDYVLHT